MSGELHFEQLHKISGHPNYNSLGRGALSLYEDALDRPLVWLNNRFVFVATEHMQVRGVTNIEIRPSSHYAYLIGIAVAPNHRSHGIGTFMMTRLLKYSAEQQCTHMQVIPKRDVEGFYARLGFMQRSENSMYWIRDL